MGEVTEETATPAEATPDPGHFLEAFRLEGRTAMVTGSSRGLGRAAALALAAAGARLVLVARSRPGLDATRDEVARAGGRAATSLVLDVTRPGVTIDGGHTAR